MKGFSGIMRCPLFELSNKGIVNGISITILALTTREIDASFTPLELHQSLFNRICNTRNLHMLGWMECISCHYVAVLAWQLGV
jgi:hypothetical protein